MARNAQGGECSTQPVFAKKRKRDDAATEVAHASEGALPAPTAASLPPPRRPLPPHQLVLAPMVGGSELAFRLLARRHGAQLCYTPMMRCEDFSRPGAGIALLERHAADAPVVAHFSGNDPAKLLAVAKKAEQCAGVVAIDLNLGCPQRSAHSGHFGAFLLDPPDRNLVLRIVSTLARSLRVPFFCKIRLLEDLDDTLQFVSQLQDAGCALLAVHGRYRGSPMHRRDGPAHLDQIALIKRRLTIPVITNGNVRDPAEMLASLEQTGADGVMSAEGALDDPAIFGRAVALAHSEGRRLRSAIRRAKRLRAERIESGRKLTADEKACVAARKEAKARVRRLSALLSLPFPPGGEVAAQDHEERAAGASTAAAPDAASTAPFDLAEQYLRLVAAHPPPGGRDALMTHAIFHLRRIVKEPLTRFQLRPALEACTSLDAAATIIRRCRAFDEGSLPYDANAEAEHQQAQALEARRAANAARRAEFVTRMEAKALKEGRAADWYLRAGRTPPSDADLEAARRLKSPKERARWWRERFGQHCHGHYLEGACPHHADPRGCGFLHGDSDEL